MVNSPKVVNTTESPFLGFGKNEQMYCNRKIQIGVSLKWYLQDILKLEGEKGVKTILSQLQKDHFIIYNDVYNQSLNISFSRSHSSKDVLR